MYITAEMEGEAAMAIFRKGKMGVKIWGEIIAEIVGQTANWQSRVELRRADKESGSFAQ